MHLDVKHKDSVGQAEFLGWAEGNECRSLNLYVEQVETGLKKKLSKNFTVHSSPCNNCLEVLSQCVISGLKCCFCTLTHMESESLQCSFPFCFPSLCAVLSLCCCPDFPSLAWCSQFVTHCLMTHFQQGQWRLIHQNSMSAPWQVFAMEQEQLPWLGIQLCP